MVRRFSVKRIRGTGAERIVDTVAAEEPLEIRLQYWQKEASVTQSMAVTMRTPGADLELTAGFLVSEGVLQTRRDLANLRTLGTEPSNEVLAELAPDVDVEAWRMRRADFVNASCGICGKRNREAIHAQLPAACESGFSIPRALIERLPELLREKQVGFAQTGGLHAAALVDASGNVGAVFEDIGRHNALDKLIGWCFLRGDFPLHEQVLFMSSRSSFELIQKAIMAGAPVLATVGGPSSLAIETARDHGLTLIGFVRDGRFNIYSGDWRVEV